MVQASVHYAPVHFAITVFNEAVEGHDGVEDDFAHKCVGYLEVVVVKATLSR